MKKTRFGVIGLGVIGVSHSGWIREHGGRSMSLGAVCDVLPEKRAIADELGVPFFRDAQAMYDSGAIDAVIIATPHYWHAPLTVRAARGGIHVLCEKPLAASVGNARAMIAECRRRKVALGAMLQQRTRPVMRKMKQLVDRGTIGEVFRVQMICSSWFRTQAYYDRGAWRGTWDGEGGGVLINQAPHSLDLFQWIGLGLPKRIIATLDTRAHAVEIEDTANVLCDYGGGKSGYVYATTAERPGAEQLMVAGDKGTLIAEGRKLRMGKLKIPIRKHIRMSASRIDGGGEQKVTWSDVAVPQGSGSHGNVIRAFAAHLRKGTPMIADGREAIVELEISNAAYLSGFGGGRPVDLPVDAAGVERLLSRLIRERSAGRGGDLRKLAAGDMKALARRRGARK